jgi:hypothetical protein
MADQTEGQWTTLNPETKGTGIFIERDVSQLRGFRKELEKDVTYADCLQRGASPSVMEFKWVPDSVKPFDDLQRAPCGQPCTVKCVEAGCVCVNGTCV